MSSAASKKLTEDQAAERRNRRAAKREARQARAREFRSWFRDRANAGKERASIRARKDRKAASGLRGVDRVPKELAKGNPLQRKPKKARKPGTVALEVPPLGTYRGRTANYATRRAMGQRGHAQRTRRRDMPGSQARRIERNQKAWAE